MIWRATIAGMTAQPDDDRGLAALVFVPGLAIGSFLNVVAARVPARRLDRRAALGLPGLRDPDRLVRQHPGRSRSCSSADAAAACARSDRLAVPAGRARDGAF